MILGTSPGVAADALLARGGVAARPSPSAVSPPGFAARGFPALSSSPSETGSAFGGTPGSHSHGSSARRHRSAVVTERHASPVLAPTVTGFDLETTAGSGDAAALRSSSKPISSTRGSSVKVSALRLGSPAPPSALSDPTDANEKARDRETCERRSAIESTASAGAPASPGGLSRGLSAMRDELETLAPKPPLHRASPVKNESGAGQDGLELADDTVEYYAARLEALEPLTPAERSDFDILFAAYPESFDSGDARDAFTLAATRLRAPQTKHAYTRALETARVLAGLGMRSEVMAAALLHGAMDAGAVDAEEARARCGVEAASMAADAARLSLFSELARASADEAPLAEEDKRRFRAMLIAMTDARVVVVKLAERVVDLENDDVFHARSEARRRALAEETLATFVPLASRLGVWSLKARLEDACFARLKPREHAELARELERDGRRAAVADAVRDVAAALDANAVPVERVYGRPKSLYGVHRKMREKNARDVAEVHDVRAVRVIAADEDACYEALDALTRLPGYSAVPERTKDYVARAKANGYRSLHAVVLDARGRACEVQIRTPEMHAAAEFGVASHWRYKEGDEEDGSGSSDGNGSVTQKSVDEQVRWARFALSWQGRLAHDEARAARRAEMFVDAADAADDDDRLCEVVPCPCPFPTHRAECANHEDNLRLGVGGAHAHAPHASNLVSADSASFSSGTGDADRAATGVGRSLRDVGGDVVTVVAVVDGRMRVVDAPRGARLCDVDLASLGGGPGDARAAEFFETVSVAVNREPVPPGAEVAVTLRMGDLVEVTRERLSTARGESPGGVGSPSGGVATLGAAAAEEARRRASLGDELVTANNVVSAKGFFP